MEKFKGRLNASNVFLADSFSAWGSVNMKNNMELLLQSFASSNIKWS